MSSFEYITYEEGLTKIYVDKIVRLDELLIYLQTEKLYQIDVLKKYNPQAIKKDGTVHLKIGKEKNGKIKLMCIGHDTSKDNSTNILLSSNKISCFKGGCLCANKGKNKGLNVVQVYLIYKLGVDPEVVLNPEAYKAIKKEKYRAVAELLEMKGFKILQVTQRKRPTQAQKEAKVNQEILNLVADLYHQEFLKSEEAQQYFLEESYVLKDGNGEVALNEEGEPIVIEGRGFKYVKGAEYALEQAKRYKLGFAPKEFPSTWLYDQLAPNYTTEELLRTSVIKWQEFKDENDKVKYAKPLDFHSYGLILPYWHRRYVINLYSRAINAPKEWRHLRLAGTVDFPINFEAATKHAVVKIVEGEFTWFTNILFGYENTLGNRGTNGLQKEHVELLIKAREESGGAYCQTIVIAFDGDKAGRDAALETGRMLVEAGFNVLVVLMPDGMDHNDLVKEYKEEAKAVYDELYNGAVSYYTFVALYKIKEITDTTTTSNTLKKLGEVKQIIAESGLVNNEELYLIAQEFAKAANMPIDVIWKEWKKENKNVEAFHNENYVFMTNDIENYYLLKFAFKQKAAYVEDVDFSFIQQEITTKNIVVDEVKYTEVELEKIEYFCEMHDVRMLTYSDLSEVIEVTVDSNVLINQMLKN